MFSKLRPEPVHISPGVVDEAMRRPNRRLASPSTWGVGITSLWLIAVYALAFGSGEDGPPITAGTMITVLALAFFITGIVAGALGAPFSWARGVAIAAGIALTVAFVASILIQWRPDGLVLAPVIGIVAALVIWIVTWLGGLAGGVARSLLGGDRGEDRGFI
jgi:hypothetical protein